MRDVRKTNRTWVVASLATVSLMYAPSWCQADCLVRVVLADGWNLVCLPLEPLDPALTVVLDSLIDAQGLLQVRAYDASQQRWRLYVPPYAAPSFLPALNDLTELHAGEGYWIKVSGPVQLDVWGESPALTIPLLSGWNLVGLDTVDLRTADAVFAGLEASMASAWVFGDDYSGLDFGTTPPTGDLTWLEPGRAVWVNAEGAVVLWPPVAERVFPFDAASTSAFVGPGGAGIASTPWPYRYDDFTFESAGFDIDRAPLACYGPEDTDAWDQMGQLVMDDAGFPSNDGIIDPAVSGRYQMLISIGGPLIGRTDPGEFILTCGGAAQFAVANRAYVTPPDKVEKTVVPKARMKGK